MKLIPFRQNTKGSSTNWQVLVLDHVRETQALPATKMPRANGNHASDSLTEAGEEAWENGGAGEVGLRALGDKARPKRV